MIPQDSFNFWVKFPGLYVTLHKQKKKNKGISTSQFQLLWHNNLVQRPQKTNRTEDIYLRIPTINHFCPPEMKEFFYQAYQHKIEFSDLYLL